MPSKLFTPANIGTMHLANRAIRSGTQDPLGNRDGTATQAQADMLREVAASGVPLIISAFHYIAPEGRATKIQSGFCEEAHYESQKAVLDAIHSAGSKYILEIHHAGLNVYFPPKNPDDPAPLGPVGVEAANGIMAREITPEIMEQLIQIHVDAALKAKEIGFDGVQLHCAHGYLLSQFLDPTRNSRTDEYGGSAENRFRFIRRIFTALREALGPDYPLLVKINSNCAGEADAAYADDIVYFCKEFEALGADMIELSGHDWMQQAKDKNRLYYFDRAKAVRDAVGLPLSLVGGIRSMDDINAVLDAGFDFVSMSRPFITQPDFLEHLKKGEESPCLGCTKCLTLYLKEGRRCMLHPKPEAAES